MNFKEIFERLLAEEDLTYEESQDLMRYIMTGELTNVQISGLLTALRMKGETAHEIAGLAQEMQRLSFPIEKKPQAIDVVGTGGASFKTFNVSSMTGLILSSMGIPVAKHGNRSNTSKSGSADFYEGLGINLRLDPSRATRLLEEHNFVYLFAPFYHRSMKHAVTARKELKARTVFNILGPLTNPMEVQYQLIGVYNSELQPLVANSLQKRGLKGAAVVYNEHGADEILNNGTTYIYELRNDVVENYEVNVKDFGLEEQPLDTLGNRTVEKSVEEAVRILQGERTPLTEFVAINAAVALRVKNEGDDLEDNTQRVLNHIESGAALNSIINLVEATDGEFPLQSQIA